MLSEDDIRQVIQVIQVLYSPASALSPQEQQNLNHQLLEAQKSDAAWGLIGPLLSHEDGNVRFFGAHTASVKANRDWETLPAEQHEPLLSSIIDWTSRMIALETAGAGSNGIVVRKLFVALAGLSIRLSPTLFANPFSTVLHLVQQHTKSLSLPLEFFKILPEEVARSSLLGKRKVAMQGVLRGEENVVVEVCRNIIGRWLGGDRAQETEMELVESLNCLEGWIASGGLSAEPLTSFIPPLISLLDPSGDHAEIFTAACLVLQEILTVSVLKDGRGSKVLTEPLLVWLSHTGRELAHHCFNSGDIEETHEALCKLLAALGEHSADYFALSIGTDEVKNYIALMLGFSGMKGYFGADEEVSDIVLPFWSLFQEALTASPHIETANEKHPAPEWLVAQEVFFELVRLLRKKVTLPADESASWMQDQRDRFKTYRFDVGDCLVTAYYILREPLLAFLHTTLVADLTPSGIPVAWNDVEASLHALRCIREAVPSEESGYLPVIFSPSILGQLPTSGTLRVRGTTVSLLGDYASWFHLNPTYVLAAVGYIVPALEEPVFATEAAKGLKRICDLCRTSLTGHIGELGRLYTNVADKIEPEEKAKVLEAVISVVQALPPAEAVAPVLSITSPIVEKLFEALSGAAQLPEEARALAIQQLQSLTAIAKGLSPSDDFEADLDDAEEDPRRASTTQARNDMRMVHLRQRLLEAINEVARGWGTDVEVAAALSEFLKAMSANVTSPTLLSIESEPLVQLIAGAAFQNLNGVWLSLAETFVLRLAPSNLLSKRPPNYDPQATLNIVREATVVLVKAGAAALATGADAMHASPDIVEGLFKYAGAVAARFPAALLAPPTETLQILIQLTVEGLRLPDRYSLQAVTGFLTTLIKTSKSPADLTEAFSPILRAHGQAIISHIIAGAEGHSPRSVVPHLAELLASVVMRLTEDSVVWVGQALSVQHHPESHATPQAREKLRATLLGSRTVKKVRDGLNEFAIVSRGLEGSAYAGVAPP